MDIWRIALTVAAGGFFYYILKRHWLSFGWPALGLLAILAWLLLSEIFRALRGTDVELIVEDLNFTTTGHAPGGYLPGYVAKEDLLTLEFREGSGGGENQEFPRGLYVDYSSESPYETQLCLLPHIHKDQAEEVIQAIRQRFPELDRLTHSRFSKGGLISLDLN